MLRGFRIGGAVVTILCGFLLAGCPKKGIVVTASDSGGRTLRDKPNRSGVTGDSNLALGNPSDATANPSNRNNYLLERSQYALAYNDSAGEAKWVSWHLSRRNLGDTERGKFRPDPDLPDGFHAITPRDYTGSGFDRGHLCPSADRTSSEEENDATFYMTNIVPQEPGLNQGPWKDLEDHCRDLVREGKELYIVAGPGGRKKTIGRGKVVVPEMTWKVILILPEKNGDDLARISRDTEVIAVVMPNRDSLRGKDWRKYQVTVGDVETQTGLQLLTNLAPSVRDALEREGAAR